jgi:hypothetical protein
MNVDFSKYKYYYNGWIARTNKETNETEMLLNGKWVLCKPGTANRLDLQAHFGDEDLVELSPNSERDRRLLEEEMEKKIRLGKTI